MICPIIVAGYVVGLSLSLPERTYLLWLLWIVCDTSERAYGATQAAVDAQRREIRTINLGVCLSERGRAVPQSSPRRLIPRLRS